MTTYTLSKKALDVIDAYRFFKLGGAVSTVPYFNNKTTRARAALRATIGKGSPKDIMDELHVRVIKAHIDSETLSNQSLKKLLVDNNLGIECSGFAYYVLEAETEDRGKGSLDRHLHFASAKGILGKIRSALRPVENCDVATLASPINSAFIELSRLRPGDMITMLKDEEEFERDHILIVHQIDVENAWPVKIHYTHAVAYPEDGVYGNGIRQGVIDLQPGSTSILQGVWYENGSTKGAEHIFLRAQKSKTELRRLLWL